MNHRRTSAFYILTLLTSLSCAPKGEQVDKMFHGMWRLDRFESLDSTTGFWSDEPLYKGWTGYILYDGLGHMGVHLTPGGYEEFNTDILIDSLNLSELKDLADFYKSNFVYFSNYNLEGNTIHHDRLTATEPKNWRTPLTRDYVFNGDTLILTAKEIIAGKRLRLRWIKV